MTWSIVSEEAKRKKKILQYEQKRQWHKWWAWHPVSIKKTEDYEQWVWFEPVYRRANDHFPWRTFCKYRWEYTTDYELLKQIY
jgi:hypothetical protein